MSYELEPIEQWLKNEINPITLVQTAPSEYQLKAWLDFVANEKERICNCLRKMAFRSNADTETILNYMGVHQLALISISNLLTDFGSKKDLMQLSEIRLLYSDIAAALEDMLVYIEQYIPDYFDHQLPITHYCAGVSCSEFKGILVQLQQLNTRPDIDKALLHLAVQPLRDFTELNARISYKDLVYLKELARQLLSLIDTDVTVDINWEIIMVLLFLDFNDPRFSLHVSRRLNNQIGQLPTTNDKLDYLHWYIHAIENLKSKPGYTLISSLPPLREQIIAPIKASYQYLHARAHMTNGVPIGQKRQNDIKIKTALSVTELAVFIKLFIKNGLIINGSQIEVIRFIAEHYTSKKTEEISEESLRSKFHGPDPAAVDAVKEILIEFVNLLNSKDF